MSQSPSATPELDATLRTGLIINLALVTSLATFFALSLLLPRGPAPASNWSATQPLTVVGLAMGGIVLLGLPFLQDLVIAGSMATLARQADLPVADRDARLVGLYQTRTIVGSALLEGPALFNLINFWIEGSRVSLVAAGLLMLMLMARVPRRNSAETWMARRGQRLEELRQLGA